MTEMILPLVRTWQPGLGKLAARYRLHFCLAGSALFHMALLGWVMMPWIYQPATLRLSASRSSVNEPVAVELYNPASLGPAKAMSHASRQPDIVQVIGQSMANFQGAAQNFEAQGAGASNALPGQGNPVPEYPLVARQNGWQGLVKLKVQVLSDGRVGEVTIVSSSGYEVLNQAALQAVKTWVFEPAKRFGLAVSSELILPVRFALKES